MESATMQFFAARIGAERLRPQGPSVPNRVAASYREATLCHVAAPTTRNLLPSTIG